MSNKICSVDSCNKASEHRGYCDSHYQRFMRHGDPLGGGSFRGVAIPLLRKAISEITNECIIWPHQNNDGYGTITYEGRSQNASRVALIFHTGKNMKGMDACHAPGICHNRACINPAHLRWDTSRGNNRDKVIDGTSNRGERCGSAKLKESDVLEIRQRCSDGEPQSAIARQYGVNQQSISRIHLRQRWAHL